LVNGRRFAAFAAQQEFAVDQVEGGFLVLRQQRVTREVGFDAHTIAALPALPQFILWLRPAAGLAQGRVRPGHRFAATGARAVGAGLWREWAVHVWPPKNPERAGSL